MSGPQNAKLIQVGNYSLIGIQDSNNALALGTTQYYQTASGLLVAAPADDVGNPKYNVAVRTLVPATFHTAASAAENGQVVSVAGYKTLTLEVYGASSAAGFMEFQAAGTSGNFSTIQGKRLNDGSASSSTSSFPNVTPHPDLWRFDVSGLASFQCPLITVTAGTITVKGNLMP